MKKIMSSFGILLLLSTLFIFVAIADDDEVNATENEVVLAEGEFAYPINKGNQLTERFGFVEGPFGYGSRWHKGIDIGCSYGESLFASMDGVITMATYNGGYGNYILVTHGSNLKTAYGHLSDYNVVAGQTVTQGDVVGYCGNTGWSSGKHLHYEILIDGVQVDPEPYFKYQRSDIVTPDNFGG